MTTETYRSKAIYANYIVAHQAEPPKKPSNWRKKHEDFIATIQAAKAATLAMREGAPLPPPPPPTYDPGNKQVDFYFVIFNIGGKKEEKKVRIM